MAQRDELSIFVRDALAAGKSRAEITAALTHAGWRSAEVQDALNGWDEMPFSPPIPRPVATVSQDSSRVIVQWRCWLMAVLRNGW